MSRRIAGLAVTLLLASFLVYGALYLAPGSPLSVLTGGRSLSPEALASLRAQYHLEDPFLVRYWHWLLDVLHGDFGRSTVSRESVAALMESRAGVTATLVAYAACLIVIAGLLVGVVGALSTRRADGALVVATSIVIAIPPFVAAAALIAVFSVGLGWFPVLGPGTGGLDRIWHLTLPAVALSLSSIAYVGRIARTSLRAELQREHVETARSRGLAEGVIARRHVLHNALIPLTTVAGITIAGLIAGAVVVEQAFGLPGLGSLLIRSVDNKDFAVAQAVSLVLVAAFIVVNSAVDGAYTLLDPRLRQRRS